MKYRNILQRTFAFMLAVVLLCVDASATIKQVSVWGAKLINDLGDSDYRVSMDTLKSDYSGYVQTDGLTEYFHKDRISSARLEMTEALGWLIDHNIVNRDETIRVSNLRNIPVVSISKIDAGTFMQMHVNRSDALMYLYKAVFGPLEGRALGVETENIRSDNGYNDTLYNIMIAHEYFKTVEEGNTATVIQDKVTGGKGASGGQHTEIVSPGYYYHNDTGGGGGSGGDSNGQTVKVNTDNQFKWRYTPQGDEYTSIFGDTNIFISDVEISQNVDTSGGSSSGSHGVGGGGSGGGANAAITYETDYKQIYYVPGADVLFYNTSDVLEMYLQAILSKGLLNDHLPETTQKFRDMFEPIADNGSTLASWSGDADPYIVNRGVVKKWRTENVQYASVRETLGVNYTVDFNGDSLTLRRNNIFQSNSGYFVSEYMTKMDAYRYAYYMTQAGEKKMTALEADIITYKYGLSLDGLGGEEDQEAVKFLIAKGILNYDGSNELASLYDPLTYDDFFTILYRVANPDARLDFSKVQLTDSETSWKARGFQSQTMVTVPSNGAGTVNVILEGNEEVSANDEVDETIVPNSATPLSDGTGVLEMSLVHNDPAPDGELSASLVYYEGEDTNYSAVLETTQMLNALKVHGLVFTTKGLTNMSDSTAYLKQVIDNIINKKYTKDELTAKWDTDYQGVASTSTKNDLHVLRDTVTHNFWVMSRTKAVGTSTAANWLTDVNSAIGKADAEIAATPNTQENISYWKAAKTALEGIQSDIILYHGDSVYKGVAAVSDDFTEVLKKATSFSFELLDSSDKDTFATYNMTLDENLLNNITATGNKTFCDIVADKMSAKITRSYTRGTQKEGLIIADFQRTFGSLAVTDALSNGQGLQIQTKGKDSYINWSTLSTSGLGIEKGAGGKILQASDWILSCNDNRAVFSNGDLSVLDDGTTQKRATALVGTQIVTTNNDNGVAYKDDDGVVWYHLDVIRLLVNANQEQKIETVRSLAVPDMAFRNALQNYDIMSESGVIGGQMAGLHALVYRGNADDRFTGQYAQNLGAASNGGSPERWGQFITFSQASRAKNMISRKLTYTAVDTDKEMTAFALLEFDPVDMTSMSTAPVDTKTMLQDILDAPAKAPSDTESLAEYNKNKVACNAYCNWIYGTTGATYVDTGYLKPKLSIYVLGDAGANKIPDSEYAVLKTYENYEDLISATHAYSMLQVVSGGVVKRSAYLNRNDAEYNKYWDGMSVGYWVSSDCKVLVTGDRVYFNEQAVDGLSFIRSSSNKNGGYYKLSSRTTAIASFTIGSTFYCGSSKIAKMVVTGTEGENVICQVGPILGIPVKTGDGVHAITASTTLDSKAVNRFDFSTEGKKTAEEQGDWIQNVFYRMFRGSQGNSYGAVQYVGVVEDPYLLDKPTSCVMYKSGGVFVCTSTDQVKVKELLESDNNTSISNYVDNMNRVIATKASIPGGIVNCRIFFEVKFPAASFKVKDGQLVKATATASDFISPSYFTSINDLVIDGLINQSVGAIPINDIEEGALLECGDNTYACVGKDGKKAFVGYAGLPDGTRFSTIVSAAYSFAGHNIRAGNQLVNVCHFFERFELIDPTTTQQNGVVKDALKLVANNTFTSETTRYMSLTENGVHHDICGDRNATTGKLFAPVEIVFRDFLLAFKEQEASGDTPAKYKIVPTAVSGESQSSAVAGAFDNVPFFADSAIVTGIAERIGGYVPANYQPNSNASVLRNDLKLAFNKVFASDLLVLLRMLCFIVLGWLMVSSWVCYACKLSNLLPILDAIKYPTGNRQSKGIDLFRVVSLGTISIESEFGLGKFLQYNAILGLLFTLLMLSEKLPIGQV